MRTRAGVDELTAPFARIMALDFETLWDSKDYTLKKLTTEEYIRDPRFKAWGCAYHYVGEDTPPVWVTRDALPEFFAGVDWSTTAALAHNAQFDLAILSWVYGCKPVFIFDSLSMARALYGVEVGNSLKMLAERFNLPPKGNATHSTDGVSGILGPQVEEELARYCEHDTFLCASIFGAMLTGFPRKELELIDLTLKMYTNPVLTLDRDMLRAAIYEERAKREGLLKRRRVQETDLASNDKFAEILRSVGVTPPTKVSKKTGKEAFAFAKTDALFQQMLQGDNEDVAALCEARLIVKSTQSRTRAQRFYDVAGRGLLPVPLSYYGAHTGRWTASKGSSINVQNLKRGSFLRRAIVAPDGYVLVVADLAQIEPRVLAYLSDYHDLMQVFRDGGDPYAAFGAQMFGIPELTQQSHPDLRQSAKSALLGAGYGLSWAAFAGQLLTGFLGAPPVLYGIDFAQRLGLRPRHVMSFNEDPNNAERIKGIPHTCTDEELAVHCTVSSHIIELYRGAAYPVVRLWRRFTRYINTNLYASAFGGGEAVSYKCLVFAPGKVGLPNGMALKYPDLSRVVDETGHEQFRYGPQTKKLYGSKLVENVTQAVARIVMTDGLLRVQKRYPCVLTVHDEGVFIVPEQEQEEAVPWVKAQMVKEALYLPGLLMDATVKVAKRYGDAK